MADFNLFSVPDYYGGLLGEEGVQKLQRQALGTGIINAALGFIAQPRNQRYGSALPYLGKALAAGYESGQNVIAGGLKDYETKQKIEELQRQKQAREQFNTLMPNLVKTTPAQYQDVQVSGGGYLPSAQGGAAPTFGVSSTYAEPTMQRVMTQPERTAVNPDVALQLAMTGDPRAAGVVNALETYAKLGKGGESAYGKIDPSKFTRESLIKFGTTGNYYDLDPIDKPVKDTAFIQNYEYAVKHGYKGSPEDWQKLGIVTAQQYQAPYKETEQAATEAATQYKYSRPQQISVTAGGKTYYFKDQQSANAFKQKAGIK